MAKDVPDMFADPEASCRHCGQALWLLPTGYWADQAGFYACIKSPTPYVLDAVMHEPMPPGFRGEPRAD